MGQGPIPWEPELVLLESEIAWATLSRSERAWLWLTLYWPSVVVCRLYSRLTDWSSVERALEEKRAARAERIQLVGPECRTDTGGWVLPR